MIQIPQIEQNAALYRANYHATQDFYNGQGSTASGAMPKQTRHVESTKQNTISSHQEEFSQVAVQIEQSKEQSNPIKDKKSMTKTYHTIKDIISSKFKSNKDLENKNDESALNNIAEELRKSQRMLAEEKQEEKKPLEASIYGKPRIDPNISHQQHQYNQHLLQQHMIQTQQYQAKMQQNMYQHQLVQARSQEHPLAQARSQEMVTPRPDERNYYPNAYNATPVRTGNRMAFVANNDQNYVQMQHNQVS